MSAPSQTPELLSKLPTTGDLVGGKYRVEGTAGVGGMGVVLCATHEELGHQVAIKFLASEDDTSSAAVDRFLREGRIVASLQSDHVVRIYDVGRLDSGTPYMVMELLRGRDLGGIIAASGPVPVEQAADWLLQASHAISEAHERGIVHRDLKPSNLFLTTRSDGSDCIKVLDFGISKRIAVQDQGHLVNSLTATRQVVGSPAYMSPEQVRNARDIDHRVDIWALGMTMYELLSGRTAFDADTFPAVCAAIVADPPPSLRNLLPDTPEGLEKIVMRCLEKDPARRYASVAALASDLRHFGSPIVQSIARSRAQSQSHASISGPNPSTLVSSRTPDPFQPRMTPVRLEEELRPGDRTMNSAGSEAAPISRQRIVANAMPRARRLTWPLLALAGFSAVAIWKGTRHKASTAEAPVVSAVAAAPVQNAQFAVRIESVPSAAEVWDGTHLLGHTPLTIQLDHSSARVSAKQLILKKGGFEPYLVVQGDAPRDALLTAQLRPSAPAPSAAVVQPPPAKKVPKSAGNQKVPAPSTSAPEIDIRSKR